MQIPNLGEMCFDVDFSDIVGYMFQTVEIFGKKERMLVS